MPLRLLRATVGEPVRRGDAGAVSMSDGLGHSPNPHLWPWAQPQSNDVAEQSREMGNISESFQIISRLQNLRLEDFIWGETRSRKLERRRGRRAPPNKPASPSLTCQLPTKGKQKSTHIRNAFKGLRAFQVNEPSFPLCPIKLVKQRPQEFRALWHRRQRTILLDWAPLQNPRAWPRRSSYKSMLSTAFPIMHRRAGLEKKVFLSLDATDFSKQYFNLHTKPNSLSEEGSSAFHCVRQSSFPCADVSAQRAMLSLRCFFLPLRFLL